MFKKNDRVVVTDPMNLGGPSPWTFMAGTVKGIEPGWAYVSLDEASDKKPIPFRERELSPEN